jgi:hypothetical protein
LALKITQKRPSLTRILSNLQADSQTEVKKSKQEMERLMQIVKVSQDEQVSMPQNSLFSSLLAAEQDKLERLSPTNFLGCSYIFKQNSLCFQLTQKY